MMPNPNQNTSLTDQELSSVVMTTQDRVQLITALDAFEKSLFAPGRAPEFRNQLQQLPADFSVIIKKAIAPATQAGQNPSPTLISDLLKKTRDQLDTLPIATLLLAYRPTVVQVRELATFLRGAVSDTILLSLKYEPAIVGGFILECNGRKTSFTIDRFLNQLTKTE